MSKGARTKFYVDLMAVHPEVTGSSILGIVKYPNGFTERFLVDCGMFQEDIYAELNKTFPWNPENIDVALLTHVHGDHIGRFPLLVKQGYKGKIYMTKDTEIFSYGALKDSASILEDLAKRNNKKPLYTESDVERTISKFVGCEFEKTINITPNIKATFFMNGHLIGAAIILVQIHCPFEYSDGRNHEDINLLFTGDYNNKNIFFDVKELPNWVKRLPLTIITEATYGDMDSSEVVECFEDNILSDDISTIIIPVFALGRSQEYLYKLKCMQDKGKLSTEIPIYFDGKLAFKYTQKFLDGKVGIREDMMDFLPKKLIYVSKETRPFILKDRSRKIILTTAGMGSHGPAPLYILEYLKRKDALIHFTGYVADKTVGRIIKDAEPGKVFKIFGIYILKNARVEYTNESSSHAKRDEIIAFLKDGFSNIRFVLVNHGPKQAVSNFAEEIYHTVNTKTVGILNRDYFFRVDPYGYVKSMTTKFN